jgi:hypothetical protein
MNEKSIERKVLSKKYIFWGIQRPLIRWKTTGVSEEYVASIFGVKEKAKEETSMK